MNRAFAILSLAFLGVSAAVPAAHAQLRPITVAAGQPAVFPSEVITITRFGVDPTIITRPSGPFVLHIENPRSDHKEVFNLALGEHKESLLELVTHTTAPRCLPARL